VRRSGGGGETLYTIGEVAAMLGVSPHTIRAWERRHGIVHPVRTPTKQRRYRAEDVDLLRELKQTMEQSGLSLRLAYMTVTGAITPAERSAGRAGGSAAARAAGSTDGSLWQMVSDVLPELILVLDRDGRIVESNVAVARTFGGVRQRYSGLDFSELIEPFDRQKAEMLYRPQLRATAAWELNVATPRGSRLYTFTTSRVRQGDRELLAVVGSPTTFVATRAAAPAAAVEAVIPRVPQSAPTQVLERLIERLPFGVAVASVGAEPRIVYANPRLYGVVGREAGNVGGRPIRELLPAEASTAFQRVVQTRESHSIRGLAHIASSGRREQARLLNLEFRPLFSAQMQMTGVLIVVEDETQDLLAGRDLEAMVTDKQLRDAATPKQLIDAGLRHATELLPRSELLIQLVRGTGARVREAATGATSSWRLAKDKETEGVVAKIATQVASKRKPVEVDVTFGGRPFRVSAFPLLARGRAGSDQYLGTIMWRRTLRHTPRSDDQIVNSRLEAFASHFSLAAELLRLRMEVARKEALLDSASNAAAVIREPTGVGEGLAGRFLERLSNAVDADAAALFRMEAGRFLLLAAYRSALAEPPIGHSFPSAGGFVSQAVRAGEPTATSRLEAVPVQDARIKRALMRNRHGLAVPLIRDQTVIGVIVLFRQTGAPFTDEEVALVQTLSGIGVLSVTAGFRMKPARRSAG
jgi:PAS domain-containing protein